MRAALAVLLLFAAAGTFAGTPADARETGSRSTAGRLADSGERVSRFRDESSQRVYELATLDSAAHVEIVLEAAMTDGSLQVEVRDPLGRRALQGEATGDIHLETGKLRLVQGGPLRGEAARGTWRVTIGLDGADGTYTLRYRGFDLQAGSEAGSHAVHGGHAHAAAPPSGGRGGAPARESVTARVTTGGHEDDTIIHFDYEATGSSARVLELRTLEDAQTVQARVDADVESGRIAVRLIDPRGAAVLEADAEARGQLRLDTGRLRLVARDRAKDEALRGRWRLEIDTAGRGSYSLRLRGFAAVGNGATGSRR